MKLAYADPPYLGCAKYYDHPQAYLFDDIDTHVNLLARINDEYDGWA